jgi:two-component system nitrogen regulation response regulator GlnG/two-component system response regulator HydG
MKASGSTDATLTEESRVADAAEQAPLVPALVLLWSAHEPERVGEVCLLPGGAPGATRIIGRGPADERDEHARVFPCRQRPSDFGGGEPLSNPYLSRVQLLVRANGRGIHVSNVGRCEAFRNDEPFTEADLIEGDLLRLGGKALFLCVNRPSWLRPWDGARVPAFGAVDDDGIIGESPRVWRLRRQLREFGAIDAHVLVLGESGTGKELATRALHRASPRAQRPLLARNAATLPEGIIDAELFGNAKNYPNAGIPERPGLIGQADDATLFLDEFGELPLAQQVHLLRVLDEGEYQRLGEAKSRRASFRLIAATNRATDALRADVLARFKLRLELPSLADRREDIPLIVRHVAGRAGNTANVPLDLVARLVRAELPGNVRDLERLVLRFQLDGALPDERELAPDTESGAPLHPTIDPSTLQKAHVEAALREHAWVQEKVWRALGLSSRHALSRLIKKFGIEQS